MSKTLTRIGIGLGILFILPLAWGLIEPYFINIENEEAAIKNLPAKWEGKEIAVISDFQVGMWMDNTATVNRIAEKIAEMEPAAVLMLGDFVYHSVKDRDKEMEHVEELLRPLTKTEIPIFAVLGNHDYAMALKSDEPSEKAAQHVTDELKDMGIEVLHNESVALRLSGDKGVEIGKASSGNLYLAGLGAAWPDKPKPAKALEDIPDSSPWFVMMHNPETFDELPAGSAPVAVAGHTHGGQLRIPFAPEWTYMTFTKKDEVHADGWIDNYGAQGNQLYVNPGIGFSDLPIRINCPPEITVFSLKNI